MYTSRKKIHKDKDAEPTEFEESVGHAIFDLETNSDLKSELKDLYINSAVSDRHTEDSEASKERVCCPTAPHSYSNCCA
ncbi:hypothetical protein Pyn_11855 [Prunus yedoensis var. nudiflora]|uniref:40S ribosomal protein S7 n=1 Tax=Prunus yedoensis var. nudiflora TaxID=2094558 RepID=A0A314Z158_PRUYE|nr:hypothetical protein Pyn_11855 [Prunus yedoensis var. nudiflora]